MQACVDPPLKWKCCCLLKPYQAIASTRSTHFLCTLPCVRAEVACLVQVMGPAFSFLLFLYCFATHLKWRHNASDVELNSRAIIGDIPSSMYLWLAGSSFLGRLHICLFWNFYCFCATEMFNTLQTHVPSPYLQNMLVCLKCSNLPRSTLKSMPAPINNQWPTLSGHGREREWVSETTLFGPQ